MRVKSISVFDGDSYKSGSIGLVNGARSIEIQLTDEQRAQILALATSWLPVILDETANEIAHARAAI
jgi:hypothetical protein